MDWFAATPRWQKPHLFPIKSAFTALIDAKPLSNIPASLAGRGTSDLGLDKQIISLGSGFPIVRKLLNPTNILNGDDGKFIIDFFGLTKEEALRTHPVAFQQVIDKVKPLRDQNDRKSIREIWWRFAWERPLIREAISKLKRYIVTLETSKHRFFTVIDSGTLWDGSLFAFALEDFYFLGILSSKVHVIWALANGGTIGPTPRYNNTRCFETFPFPVPTEPQTARIRDLGERLDAHRKRQQAQYPDLTLTDLYNVLEKERAGEKLSDKERRTHEQGLVGILRQLHDELDAAVAEAYSWPAHLPESEILERLVRLNAERAAEEAAGHIRWLRPEYQAPSSGGATTPGVQGKLIEDEPEPEIPPSGGQAVGLRAWPEQLPAQAAALRDVLAALEAPADVTAIATAFEGKRTAKRLEQIQRLLETLAALGQAEEVRAGVWGRS